MKKTALIGLMTLSIGGAQAASLEFINTTMDNQWTTVGDGGNASTTNWRVKSTNDPHYTLPQAGDIVTILNTTAELDVTTATLDSLVLAGDTATAGDSDFTIKSGGTLNVGDITFGRDSSVTNEGTVNFSGLIDIDGKRSQIFSNSGTVLGSGGSSVLYLDQSSVFESVVGGSFTADTLSSGSDTDRTNRVNLNGGTMTFSDVLYFNDATDKMDFNGGSLIVNAADAAHKDSLVAMFNAAIAGGSITSNDGAINNATIDVNGLEITLTAIPEPSSYALLAGFLGLTWVMLRRRN